MVVGTHHEAEVLGKAYDARLMHRLLAYLRPYRIQVLGALVMLLVGAALEVVGPWLVQIAIDQAIPGRDLRLLGLLAVAYLGANAIAFLVQYFAELLTTWLGQSVMYDVRTQIFAKLQRSDLRYYDKNP